MKYHNMYYKASGAVAVRRCFLDKKQVFQITCKKLSRKQLEDICDNAIAQLEAGKPEDFVKGWAKAQIV